MKDDKKIKVAFYVPSLIIGGVETVFINTIEELLKNPKLDIIVVAHANVREPLYTEWFKLHPELPVYVYYPLCNWFEDLVPKCHGILKFLRKIIFSLYKKYRRFIWRNKFKDVDVFIDYKNFESFKIFRNIKKPKIVWLHSALSYFEKNGSVSRIPLYTKVVGITDDFVNDFKLKYPEYANMIVRIYNPMDIESIHKKAEQEKSPKGKYFCHVSRLVQGKDIKTLLDAFEIFYKTHKDIKLYVVGDGEKADEFKSYANTLRSRKNIVFTGTLNNPYGVMKGAIANILSSEYEGLPTVVLESVILGVPCISSNCKNGPREILLDGKGGLLFEIGNAGMLAEKMDFLLKHPDKAKNLSDTATNGLKRFESSVVSRQIYNLINEVFNG